MDSIEIEAIVLQATPFQDYDRILTLFSPQGVLKLFVKGRKKNYLQTASLSSPLTHAQYFYRPGRKDLHYFLEGKILNQHLKIREKYETLVAAERMATAILKSQWQGKGAPRLFQLFSLFLDYLPKSSQPSTLATIFLLKILKHEGILQVCFPSQRGYRFAGEVYEEKEAPLGALCFSQHEEELLARMALARSLVEIADKKLSDELEKKINSLFSQSLM